MTQRTPSSRTIVIAAYKPFPGMEETLLQLTREHVPILRAEGLATDRTAIVCQATNGAIVEVFEWEAGGIESAHSNPRVLALWERYAQACEYVPLHTLPESRQLFAGFLPLTV